jgi:hypothetical protein
MPRTYANLHQPINPSASSRYDIGLSVIGFGRAALIMA